MNDKQQEPKQLKNNNLLERFKENELKRVEKEENYIKSVSSSFLLTKKIINLVFAMLPWFLLLLMLYTGQQIGIYKPQTITCNKITPDFCSNCFGAIKSTFNSINTLEMPKVNVTTGLP